MPSRPRAFRLVAACALTLLLCGAAFAQDTDAFGDDDADPVKLFNRGQDAHAKKNYELALEFYEEALKLRPEFPEAEYQRAGALTALKRLPEAEKAYRRAAELRPDWPLAHAALGLLLARAGGREREAEPPLRRALELDPKNLTATVALAEMRARAGDERGALELWRQATAIKVDDPSLWVTRGLAERKAKETEAAFESFGRALALDPSNADARLGRAEAAVGLGDSPKVSKEFEALEAAAKSDPKFGVALVNLYGRAGRTEDARRVYEALPAEVKDSEEGRKLSAALEARCEDTPEARASLEKLIEREPSNAPALACLGNLLRTSDPQRSLDYFKRALGVRPRDADFATGYAAALLQLRRFDEAAAVLQRVIQAAPDNYAARANFAAALYELRLYKQAIVEYKWLSRARPGLAVLNFFIGSAHDRLGEYPQALAAYELFLAGADPQVNQLEIEKVNLRLPTLRNQIKRGEGVKAQKAQ